ncbi:MAG: sigma-70 family RNA polymerase sigma factor [Leptospiraceae bacterium]|nr:sigma-70 family RNA polymerase sigma factor [Leptospiraceae bacterium]
MKTVLRLEEKPRIVLRNEPMTEREREANLLKKIRNGDKSAYIELVTPFQERLLKKAKSMLGNEDDAEDIVQDALISGFRSIGNFRAESGVYTWLYRIVINKSKDLIFKKKKGSTSSIAEYEQNILDERTGYETALELSDESNYLLKKIAELEPEYRQVLELRFYEDMSYSDMAEVIGCNLGTVKSRLFKAKEILKNAIQKDEKGGFPFV